MSDGDIRYKFFSVAAREKILSGYNVYTVKTSLLQLQKINVILMQHT